MKTENHVISKPAAGERFRYPWIIVCLLIVLHVPAGAMAGTPITLYQSFAGNLNWAGTGSSLRTQPNTVDPCAVVNGNSATLSGIPAGATVRAAYLYWAGSYNTGAGSPPDYSVLFDGNSIAASRTWTEVTTITFWTVDFFSGFADVTSIVAAKGNGVYSFNNLTVHNGFPHCFVFSNVVVSGWALMVVYEHPGEPLRVVNIYDGFQYHQGSQLTLIPTNFRIPPTGIDGTQAHISWEGDVENSGPMGGFSEDLRFNGNVLTDALNPANNQYNSTINLLGSNTSYGMDYDVYDVSPYLSPGDTSATSLYSSGVDLVLLNAEVISVTNTPVADLAINKSHSGNFNAGQNGVYAIDVSNNGPNDETASVTVTDTLPTGLSYLSSSGAGWVADTSANPTILWTHSGPLPAGSNLPSITLNVDVGPAAIPAVTNMAAVASSTFDNISANDVSSDLTTVDADPVITVVKSIQVISDPVNGGVNPKAIPGAELVYTITVTNSGLGQTDPDSLFVTEPVPANMDLFVGDIGAVGSGPVAFIDGTNASGFSYTFIGLGDFTDDVDFSSDGGATNNHVPVPDVNGYDISVPLTNYLQVNPKGSFNPSDGVNHPSFMVRFRGRMR